MTEAGSQEGPDPGNKGRDPVRRIPDIISLIKDSGKEMEPLGA